LVEYFDSTLLLILSVRGFLQVISAMISLDEMRRNSEQLVDCTVRIEQMLMQLAAPE
jgi:hypothetical protein